MAATSPLNQRIYHLVQSICESGAEPKELETLLSSSQNLQTEGTGVCDRLYEKLEDGLDPLNGWDHKRFFECTVLLHRFGVPSSHKPLKLTGWHFADGGCAHAALALLLGMERAPDAINSCNEPNTLLRQTFPVLTTGLVTTERMHEPQFQTGRNAVLYVTCRTEGRSYALLFSRRKERGEKGSSFQLTAPGGRVTSIEQIDTPKCYELAERLVQWHRVGNRDELAAGLRHFFSNFASDNVEAPDLLLPLFQSMCEAPNLFPLFQIPSNGRTAAYQLDLGPLDGPLLNALNRHCTKYRLIPIDERYSEEERLVLPRRSAVRVLPISRHDLQILSQLKTVKKQFEEEEKTPFPEMRRAPLQIDPTATERELFDAVEPIHFAGMKFQFVDARRQDDSAEKEIALSLRSNIPRPTTRLLKVTLEDGRQVMISMGHAWFSPQIKTLPDFLYGGQGPHASAPFLFWKSNAYTCNAQNYMAQYIKNLHGITEEQFLERINPKSNAFDPALNQRYCHYLAEKFKEVAGKAYLDNLSYCLKMLNMHQRGALEIPDMHRKELLLEILQQSLLSDSPLVGPAGDIDHNGLNRLLDAHQEFFVRVSTLERLGIWTQDLANRLASRVRILNGIQYISYPRLPSYLILSLKEKAAQYSSLQSLWQDYEQKSKAKLARDKLAFRNYGHGTQYHMPNLVTGGADARYSPEQWGACDPGLPQKKLAEANKKSEQAFAESYAQSFQNFQSELRSLEKNPRLDRRAWFVNGKLSFKARKCVQTCQKQIRENRIPGRLSYPGHSQFVWGEGLIYPNNHLATEVSRTSKEQYGHPGQFGLLYTHMFGNYFLKNGHFTASMQKPDIEHRAIEELFGHFFIPSGLTDLGLEAQLWHERNQLRIPLSILTLRAIAQHHHLRFINPLAQFSEETRQSMLGSLCLELKIDQEALEKQIFDSFNDYYLGKTDTLTDPLLQRLADSLQPGPHNSPEARLGILQRNAMKRFMKPITSGLTADYKRKEIRFHKHDDLSLKSLTRGKEMPYFIAQIGGTWSDLWSAAQMG